MDAVIYVVVLVAGSLYVFRRCGEGIWVTFLLLAITAQLYPVSLNDLLVPEEGTFRPYNLVIASMAAVLLFAMWRRHREARDVIRKGKVSPVKWMIALVGVFCLATLCGDLGPSEAETLYVLQQSSGWMSFFLFVWIGYRLSLSEAEVQRSFAKLRVAALVYCVIFLAKFSYLEGESGLTEATDFAYSQRIVLYFASIMFVLLVARRLASEGGPFGKTEWLSTFIFVPAIVLSGSRGLLGAAILTLLFLLATWRARALLRLSPLLLALFIVGVVALRSHSEVVEEYVVSKFLIAPEQDLSYIGRVSEMEAVAEAVRSNPVLGRGVLARYMLLDPMHGWRETAALDNGAGYLLMRTGLLGTSVFVVLVLSYLKMLRDLRRSRAVGALIPMVLFVFYLAYLPFGVSFFDPRDSWLIGILCGHTFYLARVYGAQSSSSPARVQADGNRDARSYA
jgi:O-antigen ligase